MSKLSKLLTVVVSCTVFSSAFAENSCREVVVGHYKKTLWDASIGDGLRGELVNQLARKDDLFEKITPEIEISLSDNIDLEFQFRRSVQENLPMPSTGKISSNDLFTYKVNNQLHIELSGEVNGPYVFSGGSAGIDLVHSSNMKPGSEKSECEVFKSIIDENVERGREIVEASCTSRAKTALSRYYENTVDFLSTGVETLLNNFADSEKNVAFAKEPLAPMKLHSMLGVPMDHRVFFESNSDVAIGDIIEHTSFYSLNPIGFQVDLFSFIKPTYTKFRRYYRSLGFKKGYGNKVLVNISDSVLSGNSAEVFKIRPKLLGLLKINLGKWRVEDFNEDNLSQNFEIDLNKESGVEFFKQILLKAYSHSGSKRNSLLIDSSQYTDSVIAYSPIFKSSDNWDGKLVLKIPGTFEYSKRKYTSIGSIDVDGEKYTKGETLVRGKFKNKFDFDLGLFEINKADRTHECQMIIDVNKSNSTLLSSDKTLNIECNYTNRYGDKTVAQNIKDSVKMVLNSELGSRDNTALDLMSSEKKSRMSMYTSLSFSSKEIKKIMSASEDEIYAEISKLLFGENSQNVFAKKYHHEWRRGKLDSRLALIDDIQTYRNCSLFLKKTKITDTAEARFENFDGIVGKKKGLDSYSNIECFNYYRMARRIAKSIVSIKEDVNSNKDIQKILDTFMNLEHSGIIQNLLVRLAGGIDKDKVRYTYIVSSPVLEESVVSTNGGKYTAGIPESKLSVLEEMNSIFHPRIKKIEYKTNICLSSSLKVEIELHYDIEDINELFVDIDVKQFSYLDDIDYLNYRVPLKDMDRKGSTFSTTVALPLDIPLDKAHNVYTGLVNRDGERLSKETKSYVKKLSSIE